MTEAISRGVAGRMAAVLFVAAGLSSATVALAAPGERRLPSLIVAALSLAIGAGCWFAPWDRWPRERTLWLAGIALVLMSTAATFGAYGRYTYACYFLVLFAWIGVTQPRGTATRFLPAAAIAYLLPVLHVEPDPDAAFAVIEVLAMAAALGEGLAWMSSLLYRSQAQNVRRLIELRELVHSGELLARETDGSRGPGLIAELGSQLLHARAAAVLLHEGAGSLAVGGHVRWRLETGSHITEAEAPRLLRALGAEGTVALDVADLPLPQPVKGGSYLAVPLRAGASTQGLLLLASGGAGSPTGAYEEHLVMAFCAQAGLMLERLHATEQLEATSLRDELTGLGNRRYGDRVLSRVQPDDVLVMLDLDRFKELNDTSGHPAGDDALRLIGGLLLRCLREEDHAIRWGGDEFCLVLRGAPGLEPERVVQRLRTAWDRSRIPVTFSAGIAVHTACPIEVTLALADQELYRAKEAGRLAAVTDNVVNIHTATSVA